MYRWFRLSAVIVIGVFALACLVGGVLSANTRLSLCGMGLIVTALLFSPRCEE